ncbi:hypothetical protein FOL47_005328, partial [Perkinsus chesapeaki]
GHIRPLTAAELADDPPMMAAVTALRPGHPTQPVRVTVDARPVNRFLSSGDTSVLRRALRSILIRWRLSPWVCWDDMTADMYMKEVQSGQDVSLRELADVWWMRRRTVRTRLLARSGRHAGRALKVGAQAFRWRPAIGQYGKLNCGWQPCTIISSPTDSTRKGRLNEQPAGVCWVQQLIDLSTFVHD